MGFYFAGVRKVQYMFVDLGLVLGPATSVTAIAFLKNVLIYRVSRVAF